MPVAIRCLFILILLGFFTVASAQLPPEIRIDSRLLQVEQAVRDFDFVRARTLLQDVLSLQKEHEVELPSSFHFWSAKIADSPMKMIASATKYVTEAGRDGKYYFEALELMNEATNAMCEGWNTDVYFKTATLEEVTTCIEFGKSPAARSEDNATVLHRAAGFNGEPEVIRALIEAGGDVKARNANDETPLHRAAAVNADTGVVRFLVEAGADPRARDKDNETPVYEAVRSNPNVDVAGYLIEAGGYTAKAASCKSWNTDEYFKTATPEDVFACLDIGASTGAVDSENRSSLHLTAMFSDDPAVLEVLLNAGANLDPTDSNGSTPLHYAAKYNGNPAVAEILLKAGADLEAMDKDNWTPLHCAAGNNMNPDV